MAQGAYSVDFSPIAAVGNEMAQGAQMQRQAAFQDTQQEAVKAETAYKGVQTAAANIQLKQAQEADVAKHKPIPLDTLNPLKEKFPDEYNFLLKVLEPSLKDVGGTKTFTQADMEMAKQTVTGSAELENQFGQIHVNSLTKKITESGKDLAELTEKLNSKLDRNGKPEKNPKLEAQMKQKQDEIASYTNQRKKRLTTSRRSKVS